MSANVCRVATALSQSIVQSEDALVPHSAHQSTGSGQQNLLYTLVRKIKREDFNIGACLTCKGC